MQKVSQQSGSLNVMRKKGKNTPLPLARQMSLLRDWFQSPVGRLLVDEEMRMLDQCLPSLFGYHLLQMGMCEDVALSRSSPIHHCFSIAPRQLSVDKQSACALPESLPLDSESVDVVVLQHVLEFSENPHQVLKEINRVLIARGHVVIIGFNPYSFYGLWRRFGAWLTRGQHWNYRAITRNRLTDWFQLLDLESEDVQYGFYRPPVNRSGILGKLAFIERLGRVLHLPTGGVYCVVARKNIHGMTPIRFSWEKASSFISVPGTRPAPRSLPSAKRRRLH
jgi:SAM-dependent methyltransferase